MNKKTLINLKFIYFLNTHNIKKCFSISIKYQSLVFSIKYFNFIEFLIIIYIYFNSIFFKTVNTLFINT